MNRISDSPKTGAGSYAPNRRRPKKWYKRHVIVLLVFILFILNLFDFVILNKEVVFHSLYDILLQLIVLIPLLILFKRQGAYADKLEDSEQRYQSLYQCNTVGIFVINLDGTINSISPSLLGVLGYSEEELKNQPFRNLIAPENLLLIEQAFIEVISRNRALSSFKISILHRDGRRLTFEASGVPHTVEGEIRGMIGIAKDITELERIEEKLTYMQTQMNNIFESIDVVLWSLDVTVSKLATISPACEKIYGYPPEAFYENSNLWIDLIHAEDKANIDKDLVTLFTAGALYIYNEYRIHHASGEIRWVEGRLFPERNANGETVSLKGIVIDITDKKTIEENRQKDLDLARRVQKSVLSQPLHTSSISIDARYIPSQQLGGDMYAWYRLDEHRYGVVIMDAMGHGVSASLICMSIRALLEGIIRNCVDPEMVIKELNDHMYKLFRQTDTYTYFFFTAIHLVVDKENNCIHYVNAGHTTGLLMDSGGEIRNLESTCIPIGMMPDLKPEKRTVHFEGPARLILYTDGLIEVPGILVQERIEMVKGMLKESITESMYTLMDKLIILSHVHEKEDLDDICLVCIDM
jgi:sigma-B regulation protein RsbU (phosphoserine phosphatase)